MAAIKNLLSQPLLAKNGFWSLLGAIIPLGVAVICLPLLIGSLGTTRFGLLTIIWMLVGYLNLFDLGLGRSLTLFAADRLGSQREHEIPALVWSALILMSILGIAVGLIFWFMGDLIVSIFPRLPPDLTAETSRAMRYLALTIPLAVTSAALRGLLQAYQRFRTISAIQIPYGVLTFAAPLAVALLYGPDLTAIVISLAISRLVTWLAYIHVVAKILPRFWHSKVSLTALKSMLVYGGWITVSNIVGPLMVYFDRLIIGMFLTLSAVAYYTTPFEIIFRILVFPDAIVAVLFPAVATALAAKQSQVRILFAKVSRLILIAVFAAAALASLFAKEILFLWLGAEFATNSSTVLVLLSLGVLVNAYARVPYAVVQASGRSDITGIIHLLELPLYTLALIYVIPIYGIIGAATVWTARATIDTIILSIAAIHLVPSLKKPALAYLAVTLVLTISLYIIAQIPALAIKITIALFIVVVCVIIGLREASSFFQPTQQDGLD